MVKAIWSTANLFLPCYFTLLSYEIERSGQEIKTEKISILILWTQAKNIGFTMKNIWLLTLGYWEGLPLQKPLKHNAVETSISPEFILFICQGPNKQNKCNAGLGWKLISIRSPNITATPNKKIRTPWHWITLKHTHTWNHTLTPSTWDGVFWPNTLCVLDLLAASKLSKKASKVICLVIIQTVRGTFETLFCCTAMYDAQPTFPTMDGWMDGYKYMLGSSVLKCHLVPCCQRFCLASPSFLKYVISRGNPAKQPSNSSSSVEEDTLVMEQFSSPDWADTEDSASTLQVIKSRWQSSADATGPWRCRISGEHKTRRLSREYRVCCHSNAPLWRRRRPSRAISILTVCTLASGVHLRVCIGAVTETVAKRRATVGAAGECCSFQVYWRRAIWS